MPQNIEFKARVLDWHATQERVANLSQSNPDQFGQQDVVFNVKRGRLKLRILSPDQGLLIFYERQDETGPTASRYRIIKTKTPATMRLMLADALGERVVVQKSRQLFTCGRTRIHLDRVVGLGDFIELEVVLEDGESFDSGEMEAKTWIYKLGIEPAMLVKRSYADLLIARSR